MQKYNPEMALMLDFSDIEDKLREKSYTAICGVDEAGRGPLAGPVVAGAVILPRGIELDGVNDSKQLSAEARERIYEEILRLEIPCAVGIIDHEVIDRVNILQASLLAMRKAIGGLTTRPDFILVDGTYTVPNVTQPQYAIVDGDARCRAIAAASIVAKVTRDRIMDKYQTLYPDFSFSAHKGYATRAHLAELKKHGPCDIHRRTFRPVAEIISQYALF